MGAFATYEGMYLDSGAEYLELAGLWEINPALRQAKIWILLPIPATTDLKGQRSIFSQVILFDTGICFTLEELD